MRVGLWSALSLLSSFSVGACSRTPHATATSLSLRTADVPHGAITEATDHGDVGQAAAEIKDDRALATAFPPLEEEPVRPPPPRDPQTRAELETKYHDSTPAELRARLDSLLEVLDATTHRRIQDKTQILSSDNQAKLADEVGWLSERCAH